MSNSYWAFIAAAGVGRRMHSDVPKQYLEIAGKTVLGHTLDTWLSHPRVAGVVLGVQPDDAYWPQLHAQYSHAHKWLTVSPGGATRLHTVHNGLQVLTEHAAPEDWVLVHDAVRPCLSGDDIDALIDTTGDYEDGALLACPLSDNIKCTKSKATDTANAKATTTTRDQPTAGLLEDAPHVLHTVHRAGLWRALTPQLFKIKKLQRAVDDALHNKINVRDEAEAVERLGARPLLVSGSPFNIKITTPHDLKNAESFLQKFPLQTNTMHNVVRNTMHTNTMRVGHGYDVHRLVTGRRLILGGVQIPFHLGLHGHSDADVLLHAIMDACLGAASLGDIGTHFPPTDDTWRDADSSELLSRVYAMLVQKKMHVLHLDATIIAEAPHMAPYLKKMCKHIATILHVSIVAVNIKATTTEGLGAIGRGEGIAAHAVVIIDSESTASLPLA